MNRRGVTRGMGDMEHGSSHGGAQEGGGDSHEGRDDGDHAMHEMSRDDRLEMLKKHHRETLWVYWTLVTLGIWTMTSPATLGYSNAEQWVDPAGGRGAWFSDETHTALRAQLMTWSDVIAGAALVVFGWRSLTPNRPKSLWACCFIGVWLTLAPILFWSPSSAAFLNDTLVGALVIALSILIPGMPNMMMYMQMGDETPPGWSYNPSSWPQRWIMIVTGLAGWLVSRYLAAFQLGYLAFAWDPFFGFQSGTRPVLNSSMSHGWPISDAGLGAISYTFEFLMGFMGSPARWRTMPWMVAFFGILVIPLGLTHIVLVISQPVLVHHWCALCLLAAGIMLPMIPLEVDEVVAMGQHMVEAKRRGDRGGSLWRIFWLGGSAEGCTPDKRSLDMLQWPQKPWELVKASIWGMTFPWTLVASAAAGLAMMFVPTLFGLSIEAPAADVGHLGGALALTVSVVCMGEVIRTGRYLNVLIGGAAAVAPWFIEGGSAGSAAATAALGAVIAVLALPRGKKSEQYGLWDRFVR